MGNVFIKASEICDVCYEFLGLHKSLLEKCRSFWLMLTQELAPSHFYRYQRALVSTGKKDIPASILKVTASVGHCAGKEIGCPVKDGTTRALEDARVFMLMLAQLQFLSPDIEHAAPPASGCPEK